MAHKHGRHDLNGTLESKGELRQHPGAHRGGGDGEKEPSHVLHWYTLSIQTVADILMHLHWNAGSCAATRGKKKIIKKKHLAPQQPLGNQTLGKRALLLLSLNQEQPEWHKTSWKLSSSQSPARGYGLHHAFVALLAASPVLSSLVDAGFLKTWKDIKNTFSFPAISLSEGWNQGHQWRYQGKVKHLQLQLQGSQHWQKV